MSYILDALRRAESERARGQVPGLHDQPTLPAAAPQRAAWPAWAWALLASPLVALTAAAFWALRAPQAVVPAPAPAAQPAAASPVVPAAAVAPGPVAAPAPAVPTAPPTAPLMPQVVSAPAPVVPPSAPPEPAAAPVAALREAPSPVLKLADLPPDLRREWPNLAMGGSVWSESPANRFVIVNGLLLHEGDAVAPGLIVDRIGPKSVVLRWRERRVEVPL